MINTSINLPAIVLVDDDPVSNMITKSIIGFANKDTLVTTYTDPFTALEEIKSFTKSNSESKIIIFLDITMDSMSGWEFLSEFQNMNLTSQKQFRIYMLSSSVDTRDKIRAYSNSLVSGYFDKPLSKQDFLDLISNEVL